MDKKQLAIIQKEYNEQRTIGKYMDNRKLKVPKTNGVMISIFVAIFFLLIGAYIVIAINFIRGTIYQLVFGAVFLLALIEIYVRFLCIQIVKCYQHYASEDRRRRCLCVPSCSEYALAVLRKKLLLVSIYRIYKRLFVICQGELYKIHKPFKNYKLPQELLEGLQIPQS